MTLIHTGTTDTATPDLTLSRLRDFINAKFKEPHELTMVLSSCWLLIGSVKLPAACAHQNGWFEIFDAITGILNSSCYHGEMSSTDAYRCLGAMQKKEIVVESDRKNDYQEWRSSFDPAGTVFPDALITALASHIHETWYGHQNPMPWRLRRLRELPPRETTQEAGTSQISPSTRHADSAAQDISAYTNVPKLESPKLPSITSSNRQEVITNSELDRPMDVGGMVQNTIHTRESDRLSLGK